MKNNSSIQLILLESIREIFELNRNEARAVAMSAYMKNRFQFFGLSTVERRRLQYPVFIEFKQIKLAGERWKMIHLLWKQEEREFHYLALDWLKTFKSSDFNKNDEEHFYALMTQHAWWDSIDVLGPHPIAKWAKRYPEHARTVLDCWKKDTSFWVNRVCLIHQLFYKETTDIDYLSSLIGELKENKEFFIQKAIGWALRQYARVDSEKVMDLVELHQLKGLAKREALKHVNKTMI